MPPPDALLVWHKTSDLVPHRMLHRGWTEFMKLYYAPGTSAVGIRVLLEEIGKPYEVVLLDLAAREQYQPPFPRLIPSPRCRPSSGTRSVLTEFGAIARWLARTHPEAGCCRGTPKRGSCDGALDYVVGTVHMRGFSRMIVPMAFGPEAHHAESSLPDEASRQEVSRSSMLALPARLTLWAATAMRIRHCFTSNAGPNSSLYLLPPNCKRHYDDEEASGGRAGACRRPIEYRASLIRKSRSVRSSKGDPQAHGKSEIKGRSPIC